MKGLAGLGIGLLALTVAALADLWPWQAAEGVAVGWPSIGILSAGSVAVYFLAVRLVLRQAPTRRAIWIVLAVAAAMRVPMLFAPPIMSSDVYRYVWDGRVQAAGINPYLYVPADPALAALRDEAIFSHINRRDYARTIYAPAAQVVFAAVGRIRQSVFAEKLAMAAFEVLTIWCAMRLLTLAGLPLERVLIYAWNPLAVWSFAMDAHVDAVGIGLLALALLLRCRLRDGWAGVLLGAAALVKFMPLAVGPALWRRGGWWRLGSGAFVAVVGLYACYAGAGRYVLGFLGAYGGEEGLNDGSGIWLLAVLGRLTPLPPLAVKIYGVVVLTLLGAIALRFMSRPETPDTMEVCRRTAILAACATAAMSPHYGWYFPWLALPATVAANRAAIWLSAAPMLLMSDPFGNWFVWPSLIYVPAMVLAIMSLKTEGNSQCP